MRKLLFLFIFLLPGCSRIEQTVAGPPRLVTRIEVHCRSGAVSTSRVYTADSKLRQILDYLRVLDVHGTLAESETVPETDPVSIRICYNDGSSRLYEQRGFRFLRRDEGPWHHIDPQRAGELPLLLGMLPGDE